MVWTDNFLTEHIDRVKKTRVENACLDLVTIEGFLDDYFLWCYLKDPKDAFRFVLYLDEKHFPKHFIFSNFQCLRCGLCCKNYDCAEIERGQIEEWELEGREDILKYIWLPDGFSCGEVENPSWRGCPFCRKAKGKPYYNCKIHFAKNHLPVCKAYLCSKSIPVAHLNYESVEELIELIGIERYYSLIEKDWGEEFDYSRTEVKTHKKL